MEITRILKYHFYEFENEFVYVVYWHVQVTEVEINQRLNYLKETYKQSRNNP